METVRVKVLGAGSLDVENYEVKAIYDAINSCLIGLEGAKVAQVKRGPKPKTEAK